jgi:predicted alpha/beta-hydrolase family hydrolase
VAEFCFSVTLRRGGAVGTIIDVPNDFEPKRTPVVVLAHGAGAGMRHDFMEWFATALSERGLGVVRFQFPYMERSTGGRRPPDRMDVLLETYQEVLIATGKRTGSPPGPLFIGGKSMGGRVATLLCAQHKVKPSGIVLLGYPLHARGKTDQLRADHLPHCRTPLLFVQGDRDPLCDLDLLKGVRKTKGLAGSLHVVPGGDHSFGMLAAQRHRQEAEWERAADVIRAFVKHALSRQRERST